MPHYNYSRLSTQDNDFLLWETPALPMHTSAIQIFAAGDLRRDDGGIDFEQIKRATHAVLHRMPRYRQKIRWIPGSQQAVWIDDSRFHIDYHLRHIGLPRPGTEAQLKRLASRIMEYPLDRSRPLWETWVVEGLEGDRFATIAKTHHCMIDGSSGMSLAELLMSTEPRSEIPDAPRFVPRPAPSDAVLKRDQQARRFTAPQRILRRLRDFARDTDDVRAEIAERARAIGKLASYGLKPASQTILNGAIGPHRIFDYTELPLAEIKTLRKATGASVNDIVLAIVSGAVRRFLTLRSCRVDNLDFRVSTPVNVRTQRDEGRLGNRVSSWIVPLPLSEPDPLKRLQAIQETTQELKATNQATAVELMNAIHEWIPFDVQAASAGTQNMIVTNVPGPQFPLFLMGAELQAIYPQPPLIENLGLTIGLVSYCGKLCFGFNADQDRVPDLAEFVNAIERSFAELAEAIAVSANEAR